MKTYDTMHFDNRDAGQMYEYLEARIDVMKRRISELEKENQFLRTRARSSHGLTTEDIEGTSAGKRQFF